MRALISLYHQSKDFITPSNLSDKIDEVFAQNFYANNALFAGHLDLSNIINERNSAPAVGNVQTKEQFQPQGWFTGPKEDRDRMVSDALYGTSDGDMPGLEALLDEEGRIRAAAKEDGSS